MTDTPSLPTLSDPQPLSNAKATYASGQGLALVTLTNPPANGYSHEMMLDLDEAILRARFDTEVQVIVIAGEGEKFFCAGADISMLDEVTPEFKYAFCLHANETLLRLEHTPKLVIAALGGHCVGGGLEVALGCDVRVARRGSGKCGLPEVALGVLPGTGGTQRLAYNRTGTRVRAIAVCHYDVCLGRGRRRAWHHSCWHRRCRDHIGRDAGRRRDSRRVHSTAFTVRLRAP